MNTKLINRILNLVVIMALMLAWQPTTSATATSVSGAQAAPDAPAAQMLPVESLLNSDGTLNTRTGASGALDLRGWNVTLDSARGPILTHDAPAPAAPNAEPWSALDHHGLKGEVYALAMMGSDLYVGGDFNSTADGTVTNLNAIAKYSGGTWFPLAHNGLIGTVRALAVSGSDLYVGGGFFQTADRAVTNLWNIARYTGGTWYALDHNGLNYIMYGVCALAVSGSDLYVGGEFTQTKDSAVTNLNHIAWYSGGAWLPLAHDGLNYIVYALVVMGSDLYVGGYFDQPKDGTVTGLNNIARYSGSTWSALAHNGLNGPVHALAVSGSDLYVGGYFTQTADGTVTNLNQIAKWGTPVTPPSSVSLGGPATGTAYSTIPFSATVSPGSATTPITYTWQASGQSLVTHTGGGTSDTINFTWSTTGTKAITVTATNALGSATDSRSINIIVFDHWIYLPTVMRQ